MSKITAKDVLDFWFIETTAEQKFQKNADFDQRIKTRFAGIHAQAMAGELWQWRDTADGRLAEIIIFDQFSRNMFRDTPASFASDSLALVLAQEAIRNQADAELTPEQNAFLYMPFMHSESQQIHEEALRLYTALGQAQNLEFEKKHKVIIDRFGRYPHRNTILGRESTAEEVAFLSQPNSSF